MAWVIESFNGWHRADGAALVTWSGPESGGDVNIGEIAAIYIASHPRQGRVCRSAGTQPTKLEGWLQRGVFKPSMPTIDLVNNPSPGKHQLPATASHQEYRKMLPAYTLTG